MSATITEAIERADWLARYALDRMPDPARRLHPGVRSHLTAATAQLQAVVRLLDPSNDQKEAA